VSPAWPPPPEWMRLDVSPRRLRRGEAITVTFNADRDLSGHELGLACLAHYASTGKTAEVGELGGRFRADAQALEYEDWHEPADIELRVPADAPYSYEGGLLSFYWAVWVRRRGSELKPVAYVPVTVDP
jgi:hypothetical protein